MAATLIGNTGTWAMPNAEEGLLIESLDFNYSDKEKEVLDNKGETIGLAIYDGKVEVSLKGLIKGFTGYLGATLALANAAPNHLTESGSIQGRNVTRGVRRGLAQEDFDKIDLTSKIYPLIAAEA